MLVVGVGGGFVLLEELLRALGELPRQAAVASFVHQELLVSACGLLGVEGELLAGLGSRVVTEEVPVAAVDGPLHLDAAVCHTTLDGMHLAGTVADDEGGTVVGLGLVYGLERLGRIGTDGDLCDVDVTVGHRDFGEALLLDVLAGCCELRDLAETGCLRGLAARVGVDLGVEDEDVDVLLAGDDVIEAAVADVVGPAVAAEDPEALLGEEVPVLE